MLLTEHSPEPQTVFSSLNRFSPSLSFVLTWLKNKQTNKQRKNVEQAFITMEGRKVGREFKLKECSFLF